jgi:hypothetical protein
MNLKIYPHKAFPDSNTFEFTSKGPAGKIRKVVCFQPTEIINVYNLAFGDKKESHIDDLSVSNNGDKEIILATVAHLVVAFTEAFPTAWIFAKGSTTSRTRLYQIAIHKYINEIEMHFDVYGELDEKWETIIPNKNYQGFLVRRKLKTNFTSQLTK